MYSMPRRSLTMDAGSSSRASSAGVERAAVLKARRRKERINTLIMENMMMRDCGEVAGKENNYFTAMRSEAAKRF